MDQMQNIEGMPQSDKQNGPVVGIIVVIIVLAIGGYYLFAQLQAQKAERDAAEIQQLQGDVTSNSNDIVDIQADIQAQQNELDALDAQTDADLQQLNAQINTQ
ncbi:MAG: hypothetical protein NUW02_00835 [Candidatus Campbellbacteria bacterium]|nr:hypothetical protein [Candidatus Campbellbacteria bacterium]